MTNKISKRLMMIILIFVLMFTLSACSSGGGSQSSSGGGAYDSYTSGAAPMSPNTNMPAPAPAPEAAYYDDYYEVEAITAVDADGGSFGGAGNVTDGRKITFSAWYTINTKEFDSDYAKINNLIIQSGGYVASERSQDYTQTYGKTTARYTYLYALVPAEGFNSFLDDLGVIGDVSEKNKSSDDLTSQYYDTEARIEMLEIRRDRLMKYLVEAENAADIVEFERELSYVLYELDSYQGTKRHLDRLVEFSSVEINLNELITPDTIGKDGEPLGTRANEAFGLSASGVGRFLEGTVVFFAAAAPVLGLLAIIGVIIWAIVRLTRPLRMKLSERREERRELEQERMQEKAAKQLARQAARRASKQGAPQGQYPYNPYMQPGQPTVQPYGQTPAPPPAAQPPAQAKPATPPAQPQAPPPAAQPPTQAKPATPPAQPQAPPPDKETKPESKKK